MQNIVDDGQNGHLLPTVVKSRYYRLVPVVGRWEQIIRVAAKSVAIVGGVL